MAGSMYKSVKDKGLKTWGVDTARIVQTAVSAQALALKTSTSMAVEDTALKIKEGAAFARCKAGEAADRTKAVAAKKSFQTTAASSVGGAVVVGAGAGVTGMATGSVLGAAAGLPLAIFTLGLSIPIGAVIGGGTGLAAGIATGATAGAVGGGAVGYGTYSKWDDINSARKMVSSTACNGAAYVQGVAFKSVDYVKDAASSTRNQLIGAGKQD